MSIRFNNLQRVDSTAYDTEKATFVDVSLDMGFTRKDLQVSFDEQAIKNALLTLLNTYPGENILNPTLGINLQKNLFEPITEANGYMVADKIRTCITRFEPRVTVEQILVTAAIDDQLYDVTVVLKIPSLKARTKFTGIFTQDRQFTIRSE